MFLIGAKTVFALREENPFLLSPDSDDCGSREQREGETARWMGIFCSTQHVFRHSPRPCHALFLRGKQWGKYGGKLDCFAIVISVWHSARWGREKSLLASIDAQQKLRPRKPWERFHRSPLTFPTQLPRQKENALVVVFTHFFSLSVNPSIQQKPTCKQINLYCYDHRSREECCDGMSLRSAPRKGNPSRRPKAMSIKNISEIPFLLSNHKQHHKNFFFASSERRNVPRSECFSLPLKPSNFNPIIPRKKGF